MDKTLENYVNEYGRLSDEQAKFVFTCLSNGIEHCHEKNIIHGDIKPSNVLLKLDKDNEIVDCRLSDFGLACQLKDYTSSNEVCGTPLFMAPELLVMNSLYNEKIDIWGLGCILYFCLSSCLPFYSFDIRLLVK